MISQRQFSESNPFYLRWQDTNEVVLILLGPNGDANALEAIWMVLRWTTFFLVDIIDVIRSCNPEAPAQKDSQE